MKIDNSFVMVAITVEESDDSRGIRDTCSRVRSSNEGSRFFQNKSRAHGNSGNVARAASSNRSITNRTSRKIAIIYHLAVYSNSAGCNAAHDNVHGNGRRERFIGGGAASYIGRIKQSVYV